MFLPSYHRRAGAASAPFFWAALREASASHAFDANDSIRITGGTQIAADAGKDGFHAENSEDAALGFVYISNGTFQLEAEGDGISAGAYMQITGGAFDILAGGGSENGEEASSPSWGGFRGEGQRPGGREAADSTDAADDSSTSMKGIKSTGDMLLSGGSFTVDAADDAVHSNASVTVSGGTFAIATGDDAFHADDTLTVTDGTVEISESYEGLEALHIEIQGGGITLTADDDGLNAARAGTTGWGLPSRTRSPRPTRGRWASGAAGER